MSDSSLWTPRLSWSQLPEGLRTRIAAGLPGEILNICDTRGGFSSGFAGLVATEQSTVFVKATSRSLNAHGYELYEREKTSNELLAPLGVGPALLFNAQWLDWTALAFEAIDAPTCDVSWPSHQLRGVLDHLRDLVQPAPAGLPPVRQYLGDAFDSWATIERTSPESSWAPRDRYGHPFLDEVRWLELAERAEQVAVGDDLLHADLRSDNILWAANGPKVVDWAYACSGAAIVDPVYLLLDAAHRRQTLLDWELNQELAAHGSESADGTALLAAFAGWFTGMAAQPSPPGLPTLRTFQAGMAATATRWVALRDQD